MADKPNRTHAHIPYTAGWATMVSLPDYRPVSSLKHDDHGRLAFPVSNNPLFCRIAVCPHRLNKQCPPPPQQNIKVMRELLQAGAEPLAVTARKMETSLRTASTTTPSPSGVAPATSSSASSSSSAASSRRLSIGSSSSSAGSIEKWRWVTLVCIFCACICFILWW